MIIDSPPFIFQIFVVVSQITNRPETAEEDTFAAIAAVDWEGYQDVQRGNQTWDDILYGWPKETIDAFLAHVRLASDKSLTADIPHG